MRAHSVQAGSRPIPPLRGVRVLDLTALTPGPYASLMLAELGATVLKVERPTTGDPLRTMLPRSFGLLNRGKYSIELDLKQDADQRLALELCQEADVFIEGFRPGVADRLGLGFSDVRHQSPEITYVSLSSYGQSGPLSGAPGHDLNFVGRVGGLHLSGFADDVPHYGTYQVADLATSAFAVIAVLAQLRGGGASHVDLSLLGAALAFTQLPAAEEVDTASPGASADETEGQRPANGVFVAGDGRMITLCAVEDSFWRSACDVLGLEDLLARPELATYSDRTRHSREINSAVSRALSGKAGAAWLVALDEAGVPCGPVSTPLEARADPQVAALGLVPAGSDLGVQLPLIGVNRVALHRSPALGEHNTKVREHGWLAIVGDDVDA